MSDYLEFQVHGALDQGNLVDTLRSEFPSVEWRSGDSDAQGRYIKGYDPTGADLALWLDDAPVVLTLDYRRVPCERRGQVAASEQKITSLLARLGLVLR
jgi:hypothetical protein